jgi:predicted  nucleic acid-binding Zn-ribbon protein
MIFRESKQTFTSSSGAAYKLADLMNQMMHTDDPEVVAMFEDAIEEAGDNFREYIVQAMDIAANLKMSAEAIKLEIQRLQSLLTERNTRAERLENAVKRYMEMVDVKEVVTDLYTLKLRKNPPKVEILEEVVVPSEYKVEKVSFSIDKKAIADALKNGVPVDGARLINTTRLEVK